MFRNGLSILKNLFLFLALLLPAVPVILIAFAVLLTIVFVTLIPAVWRSPYTMSVLINQKNGTFESQIIYATGRLPETLAVGDYNRDGWLDLAVSNWQDGAIGVFFGHCR